jgi:phosphoethanolamine N-methyltransferase
MATQYPDDFVAGIEWMWGEGFLSPGGPDEVRALLEGVDLTGCRVLDVGSGLGAIDILLAGEHGAREVVGLEVEPQLVARAEQAAARAGLGERIRFQLVRPGPFPVADESFDVVFSKDSMIHIADKPALYGDVLRVLKPGGTFVASDWLYGGRAEPSDAMTAWLEIVHLDFKMETPENSAAALSRAGFVDVAVRDRNRWYLGQVEREIDSVSGANFERAVAALGRETAEHRRRSSTIKKQIVEQGELRPCHLRGRKPA